MLLKNEFGSVRPYTRHVTACPHKKNAPAENDCQCPKWLYAYKRGGKPDRYSLVTPSWAEAVRKASKVLRGFDPEIEEKRAQDQKREQERVTIEDACKLWLDDVETRRGKRGVYENYISLTRKFRRWATQNEVRYVQDVTTLALKKWSMSNDWTKYEDTTRHQRWANLRSMFSYLTDLKVLADNPIVPIKPIERSGDPVQGPYTDEQVEAMFVHILDSLEGNPKTRALRVKRLEAMLALLLNTGCDLIDAAQFEQGQIERMEIDGRHIWVYQYDRTKTGVRAVVPLSEEVVQALRSVPVLPENTPEMPFRTKAPNPETDARFWGHRIHRLLKVAKVEYVTLHATGRSKERLVAANAKMLRHTFAVRQLLTGQPPEAVARMLGHVDATMVRKHYAPFIEELKKAHVRLVLQNWRPESERSA